MKIKPINKITPLHQKSHCEGKYIMNTNFTNNISGLWARESQHRFGLI